MFWHVGKLGGYIQTKLRRIRRKRRVDLIPEDSEGKSSADSQAAGLENESVQNRVERKKILWRIFLEKRGSYVVDG